jgi:SAM-dependent methyltransferase
MRQVEQAAREMLRVLQPGGHVLLRVAAYDWLRGKHDVDVQTVRRYRCDEVTRILERAGFAVVHATYVNTLLFPLIGAKRLLERIREPAHHESDFTVTPSRLNGLLRSVLAAEARLADRARLPFGLSVCVMARKPST